MKTGLILLLILNVFKSAKTEFRHHQQERYTRENITIFPWSSTVQFRPNEEKKVTEVTNTRQEWTVTSPDEKDFFKTGKNVKKSYYPHPTETVRGSTEEEETEETIIVEKNKIKKATNKFQEVENSTKSLLEFYLSSSSSHEKRQYNGKRIADISNKTRSGKSNSTSDKNREIVDEKINPREEDLMDNSASFPEYEERKENKNLNLLREFSNLHFAEPLVAFTEPDESEGCVQHVVEDFLLTDDLISLDALADKNQAKKLTTIVMENKPGLEELTDLIESTMEKHETITAISVSESNRKENTKMSQTVYRREKDLFIDRRSREYPKLPLHNKSSWTPLFRNCLTKTWIFGYYFVTEDGNRSVEAAIFFSTDSINGTIDQCNPSFSQILNGGPKCETTTTQCSPVEKSGLKIGGYKCNCREGFYFPDNVRLIDASFVGFEIEKNFGSENSSRFRCLPCPEACKNSCGPAGICIFQRSTLLQNSILAIQIFCIVTTISLTFLVFKHRKCKTIATGMWTIMEMILLGSVILYITIIIRAYNPSTLLCLIEPWCRETGFVLCYGAIILKLYRILIEFRTRKAHRWVIRDKDLLKYLLGMIIVVFGYMSAWTATNLYLIQKENYSMLVTGVTDEGIHFNVCKAVWWDYVTETGELLILLFGIHLSYASRNATTQFRERCFLCISISVEALVSGFFYILRYFMWESQFHPDLSLIAHFTRCHLSTTIVLLLLFTPKWWYQKVQINKGRVSRNYLMQESGRLPLEAFKPQDGVTGTNSDIEGEVSLADMNPEDIRAELKRLYTQLEVLKNKTIRFDNPHISKRRGGRKIAHRRFSLQALRQQTQRLSSKHTDVEVTEAEASRTPEDSVCSNEGPSVIMNDGPSDIIHMTPKKNQK